MTRRPRTTASATEKIDTAQVRESVARAENKHAALVVLQASEADIGAYTIIQGTLVIGRDPRADVVLQDEGISRRHCRIGVDEKERYFIEDLGSTNGTFVNRRRIDRKILSDDDRIYLGTCVLKFTYSDRVELDYHAQLDLLIGTDDLTGLVAKRRFDAAFSRALEGSEQPLVAMMLDLDGLKQINDSFGHPVGAYTISEVGKIIGEVVSPMGAACRFGGDEFAAFLQQATKPTGLKVAGEIRRRVASHHFQSGGFVVKPTVSIGIACYPEHGKKADELLQRADEALYRVKRSGRDGVGV